MYLFPTTVLTAQLGIPSLISPSRQHPIPWPSTEGTAGGCGGTCCQTCTTPRGVRIAAAVKPTPSPTRIAELLRRRIPLLLQPPRQRQLRLQRSRRYLRQARTRSQQQAVGVSTAKAKRSAQVTSRKRVSQKQLNPSHGNWRQNLTPREGSRLQPYKNPAQTQFWVSSA